MSDGLSRGAYRFRAHSILLLGAVALTAVATPASAQVNIGRPLGDPGDGDGSVCVTATGDLSTSDTGDDCGDFSINVKGPVTIGPDGKAIVLDADDGTATFNNTVTFNGNVAFNGGTSTSGSFTANGITSTGGLTNTGSFTNTGSVTVTGGVSAGSLNANGATISGQINAGSIVATGSLSGSSLFTDGAATVGGFLTVNGGASFLGTSQIANLQAMQSLSIASGASVDMGGNRVQNVGGPVADTDAANKSYVDTSVAGVRAVADQALTDATQAQATADTAVAHENTQGEDVAAAFGGGSTYDPATGHVSAPNYRVGTTTYNSVGAALNAANTGGLAYFHTNSTKADGKATGADATAIGPQSVASGPGSFAAGNGATASASGAVAVGQSAAATGTNSIAIGTGATATGSVAVGAQASAANGGAAYGDRSTATGANAAAIGPDATATADNATAIGSGSLADQANTVSVGTVDNQRRITNLAAGTAPSDAATVGQLASSGASVAAALGGGSTVLPDGTITAPSYVLNGTTYSNVGSALDGLSDRVDGVLALSYDIRQEERRGIAAATAMANAPMPSEPGRTSWAANTAVFHGEVAVGGSIAHRFDTSEPLAVTAGFAYAPGGNNTVKVGMAGEF